MNEIIKIERFLKMYENTWAVDEYTYFFYAFSVPHEFTLHVDSDFGDYPNLIGFEAELFTVDKSLINEKIKSINSICDIMISNYDIFMSKRKLQEIKISFSECYLTPFDNKDNTKALKFNDMDLINTICEIKSLIENYQTDRKELTTDSGDKKRNGENMQLDLLDSLFILAMTSGAKPTKLDRLKEDLRANTHIYNNKQITALTDVIYKSGTLHKNTKPPTFSKWKEQFCNIIDVEVPTAKAKQKAVQTEYTALKKAYYYLIP